MCQGREVNREGAASGLHKGLIERFAVVTDEQYDDIRGMLAQVEEGWVGGPKGP